MAEESNNEQSDGLRESKCFQSAASSRHSKEFVQVYL